MAVTPMMQHYLQTKEKYKDSILLYRLGDFYEFFNEDAIEMSKALDLTLTSKSCGTNEKAPMCGIPVQTVDSYIEKMVKLGYKVAVCEQLSEPVKNSKTPVERDVIRVITSGTLIEETILDSKFSNYLLCVFEKNGDLGVAFCEVSTGEFKTLEFSGEEDNYIKLNDFLVSLNIGEIICNQIAKEKLDKLPVAKMDLLPKINMYYDWAFEYSNANKSLETHFKSNYISIFELDKNKLSICACGALMQYLNETQKNALYHINKISKYESEIYLTLDVNTKRNLEIHETFKERRKRGALIWLLDNTKTNMGSRLLKNWIGHPLRNEKLINERLDAVEELCSKLILRDNLGFELAHIYDIERLVGRIACVGLHPKHCVNLAQSLKIVPEIKKIMSNFKSSKLVNLYKNIENFEQVYEELEKAFILDPPTQIKDGGFIKEGYSQELDELRDVSQKAVLWINKLEQTERENSNIKNLKLLYNRVHGYFFEVNKSQSHLVPLHFIRKQTVANNERYVTKELKELEEKILSANDEAIKLEQKLFLSIKKKLISIIPNLQKLGNVLAEIDCLNSFANSAIRNNYVKPKINSKIDHIKIIDGRHPVVESLLKDGQFIPNDTYLNNTTDKTMIITGPNMAGKSTYMRQVALITLMAHLGSFVPAKQAEISICDRIFTRVGASDDVTFGQSTFMVEMSEVANILHNATDNSLIVLDEIGRATSTFDGLSIAWSVVEFLSQKMNAKTLFATHYHELTELEGLMPGVKNYRILLKEINNSIVFLRKIVRGGANRSFGIEVASLAGLPKEVIERAKQISKKLETSDVNYKITTSNEDLKQKNEEKKKNYAKIIGILQDIKIENVTPLAAFEILNDLVEKIKKENSDE